MGDLQKVAIYNRCSTEEESQVNALEVQVAESAEIVNNMKDWVLVEQYVESKSGTTSAKRTEYLRMIEDIEDHRFDIIVIKSIDRLARNTKDWYLFVDCIVRNSVKLYIYMDRKFHTPDDSLIAGIKAIMAEDFSRELSKKIVNAHRRRQQKQTGYNITTPMFGWDRINCNEFTLNESEAYYYRMAFDMIEDGASIYSIAQYMYDIGVRSKNGGYISQTQWRIMIYSPRAHGEIVMHKREYDFNTKKFVKMPESEWVHVKDALPPIISEQRHMRILKMLEERNKEHTFKYYTRDMSNSGLYELSNKLYCGKCGSKYYRNGNRAAKRRVSWYCSKKLLHGATSEDKPNGCDNINVVEEEVLKILERECTNYYSSIFNNKDSIVDEALAVVRKVLSNNNGQKELEQIEKEISKLEKKKQVLFDKLTDEVITDSEFTEVNSQIVEKLNTLREKKTEIEEKNIQMLDSEERLKKIKTALSDGIVNQAKIQELISKIDRIEVYEDGTLKIKFDKVKTFNMLKVYNVDLVQDELDDKLFEIEANYIVEKSRERMEEKEDLKERVYECLKENPHYRWEDVALELDTSQFGVYTAIKQLKAEKRLKHKIIGNHVGIWIALEDGLTSEEAEKRARAKAKAKVTSEEGSEENKKEASK